jgi:16S rRNA A1518/A1519 N6-dimethyltransferase RsmA/KsgA/DIM1 with predicted DNA glycosylase/AP lyase activity
MYGTVTRRKAVLRASVMCNKIAHNNFTPPPQCNSVLIFAIQKNFQFSLFPHTRDNCRDLPVSSGSHEMSKNNFARRYTR